MCWLGLCVKEITGRCSGVRSKFPSRTNRTPTSLNQSSALLFLSQPFEKFGDIAYRLVAHGRLSVGKPLGDSFGGIGKVATFRGGVQIQYQTGEHAELRSYVCHLN